MTALSDAVGDYINVRRAMGYKLERAEELLMQFVRHLEEVGATTITVDQAVAWATMPVGASRAWKGIRLSAARSFATWLQAREPATEVPPPDALGPRPVRRAVPYLYTDAEVAALMGAASTHLRGLQRETFPALIGLLGVTGMRVSEAIGLDRRHVLWDEGQLLIERSKFGKSRYVALHPSTLDALHAYARCRDERCRAPQSPSFFVSSAGTRLLYPNVQHRFALVARRAGLVARSERCRPRIHDFRHSFAVRTITTWYAAGLDIGPRLPVLATFLGHKDPRSTYWYLTATPELLALAAARLEQAGRDAR